MAAKIDTFTSSKDMLDWQNMVILQQLDQVQLHASDPTCPCRLRDMGEYCIPKHLNLLASLAHETAAMDEINYLLFDRLGEESTEKHLQTREHVCGKGESTDLVSWSRDWRKKLEPIYYSCKIKSKVQDAAPGAVKIAGNCKTGTCEIKVTATQKTEATTTSIKNLDKLIKDVTARAARAKTTVTDKTFAIGAEGITRYEFQFKIVDASKLIVSHNPFTFVPNTEYPQELQPRLRDRAATRLQVEGMAANLEPEVLLTDYKSIDRGAPIIGGDKIVESGNGRVMAVILSASRHPEVFARYKSKLIETAPAMALSPDIEDLEVPILVRLRLTKVSRKQFVEEANASSTIESSAVEKARTDAEKISQAMLAALEVLENEAIEDALRSSRNKGFVSSFLLKLPQNEQAKLVDSKGVLNQDGIRRLAMAVFVATFKGETGLKLAEKFFESTDVNVRNVFIGIGRSLGLLAQAENLTASGERHPDYAIGEDLAKTISVFSSIKKTPGMTVTKYLNQSQLLERELNPFQESVLSILDNNSKSARRIGSILSLYAQSVISSPPPSQSSFIPSDRPAKVDLLNAALKKAAVNEIDKLFDFVSSCQLADPKYRYLAAFLVDDVIESYIDLSDAELGERKIDEILEKLESGVKSILESQAFIDYLGILSKFHTYSIGNIILIMLQKPNASNVAGFNTWKSLGRFVKKGEHGISILAPCWQTKPRKLKTIEINPTTGEEEEKEKTVYPADPDVKYFKVVTVFDYSQTDGKELSNVEVPVLQGDDSSLLFNQAKSYAESLGIKIESDDRKEENPETMGFWAKATRTIWIRKSVPQDQRTKTLFHEIAHALAELRGAANAETMADSTAFAVGAHFNFDTGARSFPYIALWSKDIKVFKNNLEVIRKVVSQMITGIEASSKLNDIGNLTDRECVYVTYQGVLNHLKRGQTYCGSKTDANFLIDRSRHPIAIHHNHPSQVPYPSGIDLETAKRHGVDICVHTRTQVNCFNPDGDKVN